jgi:hypothetical protein
VQFDPQAFVELLRAQIRSRERDDGKRRERGNPPTAAA